MNCPSNNLKTIVAYYAAKIATIYPEEESRQIVWMLVENFFNVNRLMLSVNQDLRLNESELLIFHNACEEILRHTPVQYVIGKANFCGLSFELNTSILIPRPETEQLTQLILKKIPVNPIPIHILDIGTGSGCIAVTLKKERPDCEIYACDINRNALQTAQKNAERHNALVHFFHYDILSTDNLSSVPEMDVIISNPPYIPFSEKLAMRSNVLLHEPETALFVPDEDPLLFYKAIAKIAREKLADGGKIFFEINEKFGNKTTEILRQYGFINIIIENDFRGKVRFAYAENS